MAKRQSLWAQESTFLRSEVSDIISQIDQTRLVDKEALTHPPSPPLVGSFSAEATQRTTYISRYL